MDDAVFEERINELVKEIGSIPAPNKARLIELAKKMIWFSVVNHCQICDWIEGKADLPSQRNVAIDFDDNRLNVFDFLNLLN